MSRAFREWLRSNPVTMTAILLDQRSTFIDGGWDPAATHWHLTLKCKQGERALPWNPGARRSPMFRVMTVEYSQGSAHQAPPTLPDVLECLVSDSAAVDCAGGDFESWCSDLGMDADSMRARETFDAVVHQRCELIRVFGEELLSELGAAIGAGLD